MIAYIGRRILQMIPVFIGVTIILFILRSPGVLGGDPVKMITGERAISETLYNQIVEKHGLDKPFYVQYYRYMKSLLQGDLGDSYQKSRPVTSILWNKFPNTLKLAVAALLIEMFFGIAAGVISAIKRYSFWDVLVTFSTSVLVSLPVFWLGMLLQILFGVKFKQWGLPYLPISGMTSREFPTIVHIILPAVTLASVSTAYAARIMRSQLLEVMGQDYMRTAAAKGLTPRGVIWGHGMKNAMIPVVTYFGLDLGAMFGGTVLTETVFNWPGVGYEIYTAIQQRDWPIVMGGTIIIVFLVMVLNLLVDISYAFLDPRIRYGKQAT
ncbi:MAG: ABC transporter permease [Thermoleophilia bacterium]|nr:ABC transporter permease [Thermoleophilia bacterium]